MSGAPTSAADDNDPLGLTRAGWRDEDLQWEALSESALECQERGEAADAIRHWGEALALARAHFGSNDPRLAASLSNHAFGLRTAGDEKVAHTLLTEALRVWDASGPWLDAMRPERRARSSLFHLRMEARHRRTYSSNAWQRNRELAAMGRAATRALLDGKPAIVNTLARWYEEKPDHFCDSRKLLAAVRLIVPGG